MLKDLTWTGEYSLTMHKLLFADSELSLARCLNFHINIETMEIVCDLTVTTKVALIEFIKEAFTRVWQSPAEANFKAALVINIDMKYDNMYRLFEEVMLPKIGYSDKFYDHQKESLFVGMKKRHNFFALDQGLGKTLIASSLSKMLSIKRTLIICPASLKHNWKMEMCGPISQFNELYISILDANKAKTIRAFQERFLICNYESLEKHLPHILSSNIGHIICDEAVKIKSTSTRNFKMVERICKANPEAKITLLSGSPVRNRINDLFAYLRLVQNPLGSNYAHFLREYTISSKGRGNSIRITGAKNTDLLWKQLSNFMFRKKKEECINLPPKIYGKLYFELDDYKEAYEKAVIEALEKSGKTNLNSCIHTLNIITSKAKLKGVIEFAESIIEQEEKVIVFTGYTEIILALEEHFGNRAVMINGSVDSFERSKRVKRFQEDDSCKVFLGNTIASGMGLTLTASSNTIFCDFPFSPADLVQAEDRNHRIGQLKTVNIYYAICSDSVDEHLYRLIVDKAHDAAKVIDGKVSEIIDGGSLAEILISDLRAKFNIPESVSDVQA